MRATPNERIRWRWWHWVLAGALVGGSILVTFSAWRDAIELASKDEEAQYILVAPVLAAWLAWVRRARLRYCRPGGQGWGLALMAAGWSLWSWGYRHSAPTFFHLGPVLMAIGALLSVTGSDLLFKFLPAVAALCFMVPLTPTRRHIIAAPMERYAAAWTQAVCGLLGLHVRRYGNLLNVNGNEVEVAEACNGMRQVVTFWMVSYAMAFSRPFRWYARLMTLLLVPAVAVASNVARLVPTVWVYSYGAGETAQRFHDVAGWVMLVIASSFLYAVLAALRWAMVPLRRFQFVGSFA
jgi:exosortase